jgi:hypothetical protein
MRRTAWLAVAVTLASTSACTMSRGSRVGFAAGGAAVSTIGLAMVGSATWDADGNGRNDTTLDDGFARAPGAMVVLGGLMLMAVGLTAREPAQVESSPTLAMRAPEPGWPGGPGGAAIAPLPAPLPEIATSATLLRMAQQVRAAASRGNCDAAWTTLTEIVKRDHAYGEALATGPVLAPCRPTL